MDINELIRQFMVLKNDFYLNNFSAHQDFNKDVHFNSRLKIPHHSILPTTAEVGEICEVGGKLYIASVANTWSVVGTQT